MAFGGTCWWFDGTMSLKRMRPWAGPESQGGQGLGIKLPSPSPFWTPRPLFLARRRPLHPQAPDREKGGWVQGPSLWAPLQSHFSTPSHPVQEVI